MYPGSQRGAGAQGLHLGGQDGAQDGAHGCGQGCGQGCGHGCGQGAHRGAHGPQLGPQGSQQSFHRQQLARLNMLMTNRAAKNIFKDRFI